MFSYFAVDASTTFDVINNSDPAVIQSASIDTTTADLTLRIANGATVQHEQLEC